MDFIDTFKPAILLFIAVVGFFVLLYVYLPKLKRGRKDEEVKDKY